MQEIKTETKIEDTKQVDQSKKSNEEEPKINILSNLDKKTYWKVIFIIVITFGIFYFYLKTTVKKKKNENEIASLSMKNVQATDDKSDRELIKDASNLKQSFNIPFDVNLFIEHFGGINNIVKVENSLSTIQVYVNKKELVKKESIKELLSGKGISIVEKKYSIVCGDYAESLKNEVVKKLKNIKTETSVVDKDNVDSNEPINQEIIKEVITDKEEVQIDINKSVDNHISVDVQVNKIKKQKQLKDINSSAKKDVYNKTSLKQSSKQSENKVKPVEKVDKPQLKQKNEQINKIEFKQSDNLPFDVQELTVLFGGWVNIDKVESSSSSSIQIFVFDKTTVKKDEIKILMKAKGIMTSDKKYSIICGAYATELKNDLQKFIEINQQKSAIKNEKMVAQTK